MRICKVLIKLHICFIVTPRKTASTKLDTIVPTRTSDIAEKTFFCVNYVVPIWDLTQIKNNFETAEE